MDAKDRELVNRVRQEEDGAFEELYHRYYPNAYRIAYQITKCDADAQDAVQETFIQIKRSISSLREIDTFYSWMARIVLSKCNRIFTKNHYQPVDMSRNVMINLHPEERTYMIPHKESDYHSEQEVLFQMIEELKPKLREVLYLMYFEQLKQQDIAILLNIPLSTVKTRSLRARSALKKKIIEFETLEDRKLSFNVDTLFPVMAFGSFSYVTTSIKSHIEQFFTGNMVNVAGAVMVTTLAVSGTAFAYEDYQKAQSAPPLQAQRTTPQESNKETAQEQEEPMVLSKFQKVLYDETDVTSPMEAYYTCINWAESSEQIKEKTMDELQEILPVYESLKKEQGPYWNRMMTSNWSNAYEEQLQSYQ